MPTVNLDHLAAIMAQTLVKRRPDHLMDYMPRGSRHYEITLTRAGESMTLFFSCGPAWNGPPNLANVLNSLIQDWDLCELGYSDFCATCGYDPDDQRSRDTFAAAQAQSADLLRLFPDVDLFNLLYQTEGF